MLSGPYHTFFSHIYRDWGSHRDLDFSSEHIFYWQLLNYEGNFRRCQKCVNLKWVTLLLSPFLYNTCSELSDIGFYSWWKYWLIKGFEYVGKDNIWHLTVTFSIANKLKSWKQWIPAVWWFTQLHKQGYYANWNQTRTDSCFVFSRPLYEVHFCFGLWKYSRHFTITFHYSQMETQISHSSEIYSPLCCHL